MASKVPSMATKAKYLAEFNDSKDVPFAYQGTSSKVFCKYCELPIAGGQKELFRQHLRTAKHVKNKELKRAAKLTQPMLLLRRRGEAQGPH